jgi:hypothetical protein
VICPALPGMKTMKTVLLTTALGALIAAGPALAQQLHLEVFDGATLVASATSTTGTFNPSTWLMMGGGFALMGWVGWRRRDRVAALV